MMTISKNNILAAFEGYMNAASLPPPTREDAVEATIKGYVRDVNDFLQWWNQSDGELLTIDSLRQDAFSLLGQLAVLLPRNMMSRCAKIQQSGVVAYTLLLRLSTVKR